MSHATAALASARTALASLERCLEQLAAAEHAHEPDDALVAVMETLAEVAELGAAAVGCELHLVGIEEMRDG